MIAGGLKKADLQTSPGFYGRRHLLSKEVQCGDNRGWILNLFCKLL